VQQRNRIVPVVLTLVASVVLALVVALPAGARAAHARKVAAPQLWDISFVGAGSFKRDENDGTITTGAHASFTWNVKYSTAVLGAHVGGAANATSKWGGHWDVSLAGGDQPCAGSGGFQGGRAGAAGYQAVKKGTSYIFQVSGLPNGELLESTAGAQDCADIGGSLTPEFWHDWIVNAGVGGDASRIVFPTVKITAAELTKKRFVLPVAALPTEKPDETCDGATGCVQKYDWSGTITFKRVTKAHA
jgi:hypothetical protein